VETIVDGEAVVGVDGRLHFAELQEAGGLTSPSAALAETVGCLAWRSTCSSSTSRASAPSPSANAGPN